MTETERREAEMRSIMKIAGGKKPEKKAKAEPKKPAKKESRKEDK